MKEGKSEGYYIGHGIGQGLGWLGFWLMLGLMYFGKCGELNEKTDRHIERKNKIQSKED